jgi:hypothetical protein
MLHVQLQDIRLVPHHKVYITRLVTSPGSILVKTQEVNEVVAPASRLLDDNRAGHQPLQRSPTKMHSKLDQQCTTETVRRHIHHIKEPAAAGILDTITHRLGQFSERCE